MSSDIHSEKVMLADVVTPETNVAAGSAADRGTGKLREGSAIAMLERSGFATRGGGIASRVGVVPRRA